MLDLIFVDINSKQYKVVVGEAVVCDFLGGDIGSEVLLDLVFLNKKEEIFVAQADLKHFVVRAEILDNFRGEKMFVCKFRRRKRYSRRIGHRQDHTLLLIKSLEERKLNQQLNSNESVKRKLENASE